MYNDFRLDFLEDSLHVWAGRNVSVVIGDAWEAIAGSAEVEDGDIGRFGFKEKLDDVVA